MKALGTYNFAGDIGKMTVPAAASLLLVVMSWRPALALLGALGVAAAAAIFALTPRYGADTTAHGAQEHATGRTAGARYLDRHARQRDPYGLPAVPAVPAHGQRRDATDHRACADARF